MRVQFRFLKNKLYSWTARYRIWNFVAFLAFGSDPSCKSSEDCPAKTQRTHYRMYIYIYTYAYTPIVSYSTETSTICWWYGNYLWLFFEHELDYMRCHVCHFNENAWITYMCTLRCFSSIVDLATSNPIILDLLSHETWDLNSWYCTLQGSHPKLWEISPFSGPKEQV